MVKIEDLPLSKDGFAIKLGDIYVELPKHITQMNAILKGEKCLKCDVNNHVKCILSDLRETYHEMFSELKSDFIEVK